MLGSISGIESRDVRTPKFCSRSLISSGSLSLSRWEGQWEGIPNQHHVPEQPLGTEVFKDMVTRKPHRPGFLAHIKFKPKAHIPTCSAHLTVDSPSGSPQTHHREYGKVTKMKVEQ